MYAVTYIFLVTKKWSKGGVLLDLFKIQPFSFKFKGFRFSCTFIYFAILHINILKIWNTTELHLCYDRVNSTTSF